MLIDGFRAHVGNQFKPSQERVTDLESVLIVNDALSVTLEGATA